MARPGEIDVNVLVSSECRFFRTPDRSVWTVGAFSYSFWQRYLDSFEACSVFARVAECARPPERAARADGRGVGFCAVPSYAGPAGHLRYSGAVIGRARAATLDESAIVLRVPSILAWSLELWRRARGGPIGLEVTTDPWEVFGKGSVAHPLRAVFRRFFASLQRRQCARADAVAYVTARALQRSYPAKAAGVVESYSDVELEEFLAPPPERRLGERPTIVTVGSLETPYKGVDVLIDAVARLARAGIEVRMLVVGDGKCRSDLESRAANAGLAERSRFVGSVPSGEPIRRLLDEADLFVMASRVEGLPRAMIEAMARALPCIGTSVGGIPELLPAEDLVAPNDANELAARLRQVLESPRRIEEMGARNRKKAEEFADAVTRPRRRRFYDYLRSITAEWLGARR